MKIPYHEMEMIRKTVSFRKDIFDKAAELRKEMKLPDSDGSFLEVNSWYTVFMIMSTELYRLDIRLKNIEKRLEKIERLHDGFVEASAKDLDEILDDINSIISDLNNEKGEN